MQEDVEAGGLAARASPLDGPKLPESSKELLRRLAEELLLLNGQADAAEARAAAAQQALDMAAARGAAPQQLQLEQQLQDERQRAAAAERRVAEVERRSGELDAELAAKNKVLVGLQQRLQREQCPDQLQLPQQPNKLVQGTLTPSSRHQEPRQRPEEVLTLRQQLVEERRRRQAAEARVQHLESQMLQMQAQVEQAQQQQRRRRQADAAAPGDASAAATAAVAAANAEDSQITAARRSSNDDETLNEPAAVQGPGVQARQQAAGGTAPTPAAVPGGLEAMRPPPRRLGGLKMSPRQDQGQVAGGRTGGALHKRQGEGEGLPSASKHQRRAAAAMPAAAGGRESCTSPGESAVMAEGVLRRGLQPGSATGSRPAAATAAGGGSERLPLPLPVSPSLGGAGVLLLNFQEQAAQERQQQDSGGGSRWRAGKSISGGGGSIGLKPGETAQQWLNKSIVPYLKALLREPRLRAVFGAPVPPDTPGYLAVIDQPIDLGTIKAKAAEGHYTSPAELRADLNLVVDNAKRFNHVHTEAYRAAQFLLDQLNKPHSFFTKVDELYRQVELQEVVLRERAQQERELEEEESKLAASVQAGHSLAVYARDDEQGNKYYLLQAVGPVKVLVRDESDDFGQEHKRGDRVVKGHYFDYWIDRMGKWDRQSRPYYLQSDQLAYVPASSLLQVDFPMRERPKLEISPYTGKQHRIYEVSSELHNKLRLQIKKFLADATV